MVLFGFVLVLATVVTIPAVLFIPRQRQSPLFDRVLWGATWALAIIGAYALPDFIGSDSPLNSIMLAQMRVVSMGLGAIIGALSINVLLWSIDRFSSPSAEEDPLANSDAVENSPSESDDSNSPRR